ncbi:MAG: iron ABC transporter substrate-binding protein [Acidimicrobiales bacterium]|nr:iron ABC transporter substrate-binding protein [Actinomycetota bacterium]
MTQFRRRLVVAGLLFSLLAVACGSDSDDESAGQGGAATSVDSGPKKVTVYSGRSERLVAPLLEQFTRDTGIEVDVRYADSSALAAQLIEEGSRSPADVFFSQDAGALGALSKRGLLGTAPAEAVQVVEAKYRAKDNTWVGVSGRARVIAYNPQKVPEAEVPKSVFALTDPKWKGRIGFAPTNASFQSFVTAMRVQAGEARTKEWLTGLKANEPQTFPGNGPVVTAVDEGQVDLGLVNHYYRYERAAAVGQDKVVVKNGFTTNGDPGALINVAGAGILKSTKAPASAAAFVNYLLAPAAQAYFAEKTYEYPLIPGVPTAPGLPSLTQIQSPNIDLSDLDTLEQTLNLIREAGLL